MGQLEDLILKCDRAFSEDDQSMMREICTQYMFGYDKQVTALTSWSYDEMSEEIKERLKEIRSGLAALQEKRDYDLALAKASSSSVSTTANATASVSVKASFSNTMSQLWQIPDEDLEIQKKDELGKKLQDIEAKKKDATKLVEACKALADWMFDNAIKAIPTVMPYLTQTVQGLFS
ncbi:hypothetical protein [Adlercreutzia caecimuris]|uniref:Uncharacterized protein n=1 Tax=Adlercreutzia caecimuris TaxID=671266 RepID=A0A4S4G5Q7_9ACTN|nr:hypothetical protein [Adlercreutzia caecimuris]THG38188.1 hypothetical protein E5986_01795 [Adlercreutzia caecimuris]